MGLRKKELDNGDYQPISCDYVDIIEHLATIRKEVEVKYLDESGDSVIQNDILVTWENDGKAEFLITKTGSRIRLDHIISLDGKMRQNDSCQKE